MTLTWDFRTLGRRRLMIHVTWPLANVSKLMGLTCHFFERTGDMVSCSRFFLVDANLTGKGLANLYDVHKFIACSWGSFLQASMLHCFCYGQRWHCTDVLHSWSHTFFDVLDRSCAPTIFFLGRTNLLMWTLLMASAQGWFVDMPMWHNDPLWLTHQLCAWIMPCPILSLHWRIIRWDLISNASVIGQCWCFLVHNELMVFNWLWACFWYGFHWSSFLQYPGLDIYLLTAPTMNLGFALLNFSLVELWLLTGTGCMLPLSSWWHAVWPLAGFQWCYGSNAAAWSIPWLLSRTGFMLPGLLTNAS